MTASAKQPAGKLAANRKALRDYFVVERLEAGIELRGTEVKSVRAGEISLAGAYARVENRDVIAHHINIAAYEFGNQFNHDPVRPRRLLLHRREIEKLATQTQQKGLALVPLSIYLKRGRVKVELGVCRGKAHGDKRETLKRRTAEREAQREMARERRR